MDSRLEKIDFVDLVKEAKLVAIRFFPFLLILSLNVTNTTWLLRQFHNGGNVASFKENFFRIAGTSEAETLVSEKAECLHAIGEDKK